MAKGNMFLGTAAGKLGDVVFYRTAGQQASRVRIRNPKNPRSAMQLLQRTILKTSSSAFSFMQNICNHSFEGRSGVTENQSRFVQLNIAQLRNLPDVRDLIANGEEADFYASAVANFASKDSYGCELNPYVVSEGSLQSIAVEFDTGNAGGFIIDSSLDEDFSYQQICDLLGLVRGDQLTFLFCYIDDTEGAAQPGQFNAFKYSRVILEPSTGDMSETFFEAAGGSSNGFVVASPNPRNEGNLFFNASTFTFYENPSDAGSLRSGVSSALAAVAVIASRQSGGKWLRSSQSLVLRPDSGTGTNLLAWDHHTDYLGNAMSSFSSSSSRSMLYLNQAENFRAGEE
jgi:hypothetical protein